ncbi:TldD/PmbA family protein [Tissierella sp. MSJ-40]|uniref:TldD/PmbA family protein n=1 Tax=Tissierella simiarum TaxID=2841534 RepID=A0ABS6E7Q1_9FIRM|nr:TldD/PmbA family protein [Tissierella simiarum]MBU5438950.1 TldD/PmbA family protein [Tissierella simiarum]
MDYKKLANDIFEQGKDKMEEMEIFIQKSKGIEIKVFNGEIDKYSISESGGLSLRGISNEKMGYAYTEKIDESSIDMLIDEAFENGKYIDSLDKENIFAGSDKYEEVDNYNEGLNNVALEDKIEFVKNLEKEALAIDNKVFAVEDCVYEDFERNRYLINTKGVDLSDKSNGAFSYISVIAKEGEDTKTGLSYRISNDFSKFNYKEMAKEAVEEAISLLGATSIKSNNYPVVFKNQIFAEIIGAFIPVFSAEEVQKGLSLLKDKIGTKLANEKLSIVDDPFLKGGFATKAFDDEGTKTQYKKIIDNGVLNTYLHNWKTAEKDGIESTGNGCRTSYKSSLSIFPTNLYVEKGDKTFDELIGSIDNGLYIINVAGLHSGLNTVSGDYSLSAYGYEIENGKIKRPVNQITIAGNLYETLMNIEEIGNDLSFTTAMGGAFVGSPSVKIKSISVAGE